MLYPLSPQLYLIVVSCDSVSVAVASGCIVVSDGRIDVLTAAAAVEALHNRRYPDEKVQ